MNEKELTADIGNAIWRVMREHNIEPDNVQVKITPLEIRILVQLPLLKEEKNEVQPKEQS